jgi:hypothetical protein
MGPRAANGIYVGLNEVRVHTPGLNAEYVHVPERNKLVPSEPVRHLPRKPAVFSGLHSAMSFLIKPAWHAVALLSLAAFSAIQSIAHGQMMRRTLSLRTTLPALIAVPLLLAALPSRAEEASALVISIVTNLAPGDLLNVRATPSPIGKTEARLPSGSSLKNLGCNGVNGHRWCKVEDIANPQLVGWAPARYLNPENPATVSDADVGQSAPSAAEAFSRATADQPPPDLKARLGDPETAETAAEIIGKTAIEDAYTLAFAADPSTGEIEAPAVNAPAPTAAGEVPCARYIGQPMTSCAASIVRMDGDKADVTVTWPDGGTRVISFSAGLPSGSNAPGEFRFTREGSLSIIRVGVSERFEITDALALGD